MTLFKKIHVNLNIAADNNEAVRRSASPQHSRGVNWTLSHPSPYHGRVQSNAGIDFYGMDYAKAGGVFVERSFESAASWHTGTYPGSSTVYNAFDPLASSQWTAYKNFLLSLPEGETLKTYYKKFEFETSDFYYVDVENYADGDTVFAPLAAARPNSRALTYKNPETLVSTENWTADKGLQLDTQKPNLRVKNYGYFEEFDTGDTVNFKVTATPVYTDAPVSFNVARTHTDVFLVPRLVLEEGVGKDSDASQSTPATQSFRYAVAGALFVQLPRFFKDFALAFNTGGIPRDQSGSVGYLPTALTGSTADNARRTRQADAIYGRAVQRIIKYVQHVDTGGPVPDDGPDVAALSEWASFLSLHVGSGAGHFYNRTARGYGFFQSNEHGFVNPPAFVNDGVNLSLPQAGSLVGILQQADATFYVWAKRENPGYHRTFGRHSIINFNLTSAQVPTQTGGVPDTYNQWDLR